MSIVRPTPWFAVRCRPSLSRFFLTIVCQSSFLFVGCGPSVHQDCFLSAVAEPSELDLYAGSCGPSAGTVEFRSLVDCETTLLLMIPSRLVVIGPVPGGRDYLLAGLETLTLVLGVDPEASVDETTEVVLHTNALTEVRIRVHPCAE